MQDYQAKKMAKAAAATAMAAAFPNLVKVGGKVDSLNAAAKNVRIELKAAFPGVKFSVRSERFSGGDALRIQWEDGPNGDQVDAIASKYKAGSFNGMEDIYEYSADAWNDAFGDAKYITLSRMNSAKAKASAIRSLWLQNYAELADMPMPSVEEYEAGVLRNIQVWNQWAGDLVYRIMAKRIWCIAKKAAPVNMEGVEA